MYVRLKFTAGNHHFSTAASNYSNVTIQEHIRRVLIGTVTPAQLPTNLFDVNNCVVVGSLPSEITISSGHVSNGTVIQNFIQFTKNHSQNSNFTSLFRIYQANASSTSGPGVPRMLSSNNTNEQPLAANSVMAWFNNTASESNHLQHGLSEVEYQFFITSHWIIWNVITPNGGGGTGGVFDVEATGSDNWARSLNSLYTPQIFISAHGNTWPSSSVTRTTESGTRLTAIYQNLSYDGDGSFTNISNLNIAGYFSSSNGITGPHLYPHTTSSFFTTRDEIGDTQNYMIPVYYFGGFPLSNVTPSSRCVLNGRIPFLWRTSDNAGQTGQTATVGGVEYRFVRMHMCGSTNTTNCNAGTYMVPTTIGGV